MSVSTFRRIAKEVMNYYRRPLPSLCVSFSSEEGKTLFKEAMMSGQMENYFRVASQLRTQDEPSFCGLATLVMCLNALEVDPGRIWKGPWRWYHEKMLDCCIPLNTIKEKGITLDQFVCIAKCNGLTTDVKRMSEPQSFEDFKNLLLRITKRDDEILVVSYSRKTIKQTGDGHFAPVGGFNKAKEMVLLFDTARFKYPPHWVPIHNLWDAMFAIDPETGKPRGYMILTKDVDSSCLLLLSTSVHLNEYLMTRTYNDAFSTIIQRWTQWLGQTEENISVSNVVSSAVGLLLDTHLSVLESGAKALFPLTCHNIFAQGMNQELESAMSAIIKDIVESKIGIEVSHVIDNVNGDQLDLLSDNVFLLPKLQGCTLLMLQDRRMKLTFLITSWLLIGGVMKYDRNNDNNNNWNVSNERARGVLLERLAMNTIDGELLLQSRTELTQLSKKLTKMHTCREQEDQEQCCTDIGH